MNPGELVSFSDTTLYAAEVRSPEDGRTVHVLGYENSVAPPRDTGWVGRGDAAELWASVVSRPRPSHRPNAMVLPFPARPRSMTAANVLDTRDIPSVLVSYSARIHARRPPPEETDTFEDALSAPLAPAVQVFDSGSYTVVLAADAHDVPAAVDRVPPERRPKLNPALFDAYARWYPGWTIALCCFDAAQAMRAEPLLWWYEPLDGRVLFLPALDSHDGRVPDLALDVRADHTVVVGSHGFDDEHPHKGWYPDDVDAAHAARPYLVRNIVGRYFDDLRPNGDYICAVGDVRRGRFLPKIRPPGTRRWPPQAT